MIRKVFLENWKRKLFALIAASVVWLVINSSITSTRTFSHVPVRIVNLPPDKTIRGLMPNGILDRKITLTLTGTKQVIDKLEPGDFEVVLDAYGKTGQWIAQVAKKNLVSLNPDIDLIHNVTALSQNQFVIPLSQLMTAKIAVYVPHPKGEPPEGYQFVGITPKKLTHVISGPEEDVKELQAKGLELTIDLSKITTEDLKQAASEDKEELSFYVPESWKKVQIPFYHDMLQEINGIEAKNLRIDFLKRDLLPLGRPISVTVFYPLEYANAVNPQTHPLIVTDELVSQYGVYMLKTELYLDNVSQLFLDIVKNNLQICIIAHPKNHDVKEPLSYFLDLVDPHNLEDAYAKLFISQGQKEDYIHHRFRVFKRNMTLKMKDGRPFEIKAYLESAGIRVITSKLN